MFNTWFHGQKSSGSKVMCTKLKYKRKFPLSFFNVTNELLDILRLFKVHINYQFSTKVHAKRFVLPFSKMIEPQKHVWGTKVNYTLIGLLRLDRKCINCTNYDVLNNEDFLRQYPYRHVRVFLWENVSLRMTLAVICLRTACMVYLRDDSTECRLQLIVRLYGYIF